MTKQEAVKYLTRRYEDQCDRFLNMRNEITLEQYLQANLKYMVHSRYWRDR